MELNERAAIFSEGFPGVLEAAGAEAIDWFTQDVAQEVLFTFAGAWPALGRDQANVERRYVYVAPAGVAYRLRGIELAPGAIVVDDIVVL
ncbi:MAG: hypothetical protein AAF962_22060 [Actinomycetota bacterium]